jgi:hypothetical protein
MSSPPLPVYLIHWNAPDWVQAASDTILGSDIDVAVTVVDNGPASATAELNLDPRVTVVSTDTNLGYAGGANVGLRDWLAAEPHSDWCVVAAHDLHVEPDTLRRLLEAGGRSPGFGILGPATTTNYAGTRLAEHDGIEERDAMSGTCLLIRRECVEEVGLFDEAFGSYAEDKELCYRARALGWKVGRVPDARAEGLGTRSPDRTALLAGNNVLFELRVNGWGPAVRRLIWTYRGAVTALRQSVWGSGTWADVSVELRGARRATSHLTREAVRRARGRRPRR